MFFRKQLCVVTDCYQPFLAMYKRNLYAVATSEQALILFYYKFDYHVSLLAKNSLKL